MLALRREWGAFHPLLAPNGSLDLQFVGEIVDRELNSPGTIRFDKTFHELGQSVQVMLGILLRGSAARCGRRRGRGCPRLVPRFRTGH